MAELAMAKIWSGREPDHPASRDSSQGRGSRCFRRKSSRAAPRAGFYPMRLDPAERREHREVLKKEKWLWV